MDGLAAAAFCFGLVGVVALVRLEKLIKTAERKGSSRTGWQRRVIHYTLCS